MTDLIKIETDNSGRRLVSGRELHEFLELNSNYTTWFNRMCCYGFNEEIDYTMIWSDSKKGNAVEYLGSHQKMAANGYELDHGVTVDMAKEISMIQRSDKGKQAREYFISCEKKLKEVTMQQLPADYLTALKALVQSEEQKALMQPQVEYYQRVLNPNSESEQQGYVKYVTVTAIAKDLHMSAQKLNKTLNELHIIYKQGKTWYLYAEHEDKVSEYADYFINEHGQTLKFSEKGREWIIKLLEENKEI